MALDTEAKTKVSGAQFPARDEILDGRVIGSGEAGPMARHLSDLFRQWTETEGDSVVSDG